MFAKSNALCLRKKQLKLIKANFSKLFQQKAPLSLLVAHSSSLQQQNQNDTSNLTQHQRLSEVPGVILKSQKNILSNGRYTVKNVIGRGRFGVIKLAIDHDQSDKHVALKIISKNADQRVVKTELKILKRLYELSKRNDDFSKYFTVPIEFIELENEFIIVFEYLWGNDLFDRIMIKGYIPEEDLKPVIWQTIKSLHLLHNNGIIHRDIKPENILFRVKNKISTENDPYPRNEIKNDNKTENESWEDLEGVICDFGLSCIFDDINEKDLIIPPAGTFGYASPQAISLNNKQPLTPACDIWSLGVTMYSCLAGEMPFPATSDGNTSIETHLAEAYRGPRFINSRFDKVSDEATDLLNEMLHYSPYNRISVENVIKHPWFKSLQ